jgi:hypothetical protein
VLADVNGDGINDIITGKRWWAHGPDKDPDPMGTPVCMRSSSAKALKELLRFTDAD